MSIGTLTPRLRAAATAWLRRDGLALLLFALAVVAMTYPLAFRLGAGLPTTDREVFTAHWQVWYLGEVMKNGLNPNFTTYLFHPNGLDLTFMNHPWTGLVTWRLFTAWFGDAAGMNVNTLLGLLTSAYTAYLLVRHLTSSRVAAWVGGAFYAFYPSHVVRAFIQPRTGSIQWLPLFVLALVVGLERAATRDQPRQRLIPMVAAALAMSLNAYVSIKPWIQSVFLGALYVPLATVMGGWWRKTAYLKALGVLAACSLLFVLPVAAPSLLSAGTELQYAIEQHASKAWQLGADAAAFVRAAPELPLFMPRSLARLLAVPYTKWPQSVSVYLGLISIALAIFGLMDSERWTRQYLVWPIMALVLWSLSLGTDLHVDGVRYRDLMTPYRLVKNNPWFEIVRVPYRLTLAFSVPWAVMVGCGVAHLWRRLTGHRWLARAVVGCLCALMLFELADVPVALYPLNVSPFYDQLRADGGEGAIIDLPVHESLAKRYMYLQTVHRRPIVEGKVARMPHGAYTYIKANRLLHAWRKTEPLTCEFDVGEAIDHLLDDGFRYVVLHEGDKSLDWSVDYFSTVEPVYRDEFITVFTLADLRAHPPCEP